MKKRLRSVALSLLLFVCAISALTACTPSHGIPNGTYHSSDKDGNITRQGLEYAWQMKDNNAEHLYVTYEIIKENDKVYFCQSGSENSFHKLEVAYSTKTKILTIYKYVDNHKTTLLYKR